MTDKKIRGLIVSLGGTANAIVPTILLYKPETILFFVSKETQSIISEVKGLVEKEGFCWTFAEPLITPDAENINDCYEELLRQEKAWRDKYNLSAEEVVVDFTAGTKAMTAALVLYAVNFFHKFSYVGGNERTKGGVGVVVNGQSKIVTTANPLDAVIFTHLNHWRIYSKASRYELIAQEAKDIAEKISDSHKKVICDLVASIYQALSAYDRFEKKDTFAPSFKASLAKLYNYQAGANNKEITCWYEKLNKLGEHFSRINDDAKKEEEWIYALISNAKRRAEQEQKCEDAIARLYSALERIEQMKVFQKTGHRTRKFPLAEIPPALKNDFQRLCPEEKSDTKTIKIGLDKGMRLLEALGDEIGKKFRQKGSPWQGNNGLLTKRNFSILAHGDKPVSKDDFNKWWDELQKLWPFDPARLPLIPDLPEIWW